MMLLLLLNELSDLQRQGLVIVVMGLWEIAGEDIRTAAQKWWRRNEINGNFVSHGFCDVLDQTFTYNVYNSSCTSFLSSG